MRVRAPLVIVAGAIAPAAGGSASASPTTTRSTRWSGASRSRAGRTPATARRSPPRPTRCSRRSASCSRRWARRPRSRSSSRSPTSRSPALGYLVFLLGTRWFSWPVGLAAAAFVLSRYEVLSYGVRAYADVPYVVLVLAALAIESRRRRAGLAGPRPARARRPAAPRGVALRRRLLAATCGRRGPRASASLLALAVAAAPVLWVISDAAITGHPLWSLTNTRATAKTLDRATGHPQRPLLRRAAAGRGARARRPRRRRDRRHPRAVAGALARAAGRGRRACSRSSRSRSSPPRACRSRTATSSWSRRSSRVFARRRAARLAFAARRRAPAPAAVAGGVGARRGRDPRLARRGRSRASTRRSSSSTPADQSLSAQQRIANDLDRADAARDQHALRADRVPYATPVPLLALVPAHEPDATSSSRTITPRHLS